LQFYIYKQQVIMKRKKITVIAVFGFLMTFAPQFVNAQKNGLKLVFIRHAEKSDDGDNLNCKGFNRSLMLPQFLFKKIGKPSAIYIPAVKTGKTTRHSRMFQTISPFVIKYDLAVNSTFDVEDYKGIARDLAGQSGTVLIVWEHQSIIPIIQYLGVSNPPSEWPSSDFDSIWIVSYQNGKAVLAKDKENLSPAENCQF